MWERRDLNLIGVLALREIILALDREKARFSEADWPNGLNGVNGGDGRAAAAEDRPELTAGSVCRRDCFTVKVSGVFFSLVSGVFFSLVGAAVHVRTKIQNRRVT